MSGLFGEDIKRDKHKSVEWYTPGWVFDELGIHFDLDPASPADMETAVPARIKYTMFDNGLLKPWIGSVWLNPPYGRSTPTWMGRFIEHGNGIAMTFSRTDTEWCHKAMRAATAFLFLRGRIDFVPGKENEHKRSRAGAGTVMFAMGDRCAVALSNMKHRGFYIRTLPTTGDK